MIKNSFFGLLACCLFSISSAQSLISLDEIVVSDNKLELPRATKTKRVIRLEAEELQRYAGQPLALVLNNLTGIEISVFERIGVVKPRLKLVNSGGGRKGGRRRFELTTEDGMLAVKGVFFGPCARYTAATKTATTKTAPAKIAGSVNAAHAACVLLAELKKEGGAAQAKGVLKEIEAGWAVLRAVGSAAAAQADV